MANEEQQEEEFTFPTFTGPFPSSVDSPPLWSLSPAASPDSPHSTSRKNKEKQQQEKQEKQQEDQEEEEYCKSDSFPLIEKNDSKRRSKSFSWIERGHGQEDQEDQEEEEINKMDMLWEDFNFNEERSTSSTSSSSSDHHNKKYYNMGLSCLHPAGGGGGGLRLSKLNANKLLQKQQQQHRNSGSTTTTTGFVMFIKVLKKLFLMHRHRQIDLPRNHCSVHIRRPVNLS